MDKIKTIISKEWAEVFKNRIVLFTVLFLPLIMTALPLIMIGITGSVDEATLAQEMSPSDLEFFGDTCIGLNSSECTIVYTASLFMMMFMILPVAIPVTIAAYSIVGEKTSRSLEPLLATPITTTELLAGKMAAAVLPAVLATWAGFFVYIVGARFMVNDTIFARLMDPMWLLAVFIVGPLLALLSVSIAIMVSSRVSDPRIAEQLSALVILPLIMLVFGQSMGWIILNSRLIMMVGAIVAVADGVLVWLSVQVFERERILTRWK